MQHLQNNMSDKELMKSLEIDNKILSRFKEIQRKTIIEAKQLIKKREQKIKVLGIWGRSWAFSQKCHQWSQII